MNDQQSNNIEHSDLYQTLFNAADAAMVTIADDTTICLCNPAFEELSGFQRSEIVGRLKWIDFVFDDDREWMLKLHRDRRMDESSTPSKYEFRFVDRDKHIKNVIVKVGMLPDARTSVATLINITERKQMEHDLEEKTQQLQSVLDNIGIGVALISPEMKILDLNRQMREWFPEIDVAQRPICYQSFNDPPREKICDYCPTCKTIKDGKVYEEITVTPMEGDIRNYRIVSSPICNVKGEVIAAIELVEDITSRLAIEARAREAQKLESLGVLSGGIAHDFNNILSSVIGYTELTLEDAPKGSAMFENLQEIYSAGLRAKDLIRQILCFARQAETELVPTSMSLIGNEVVKLIRASIPATIEITTSFNSNSHVLANPTQIHQVLMNLITNAAHAIEPDVGTIHVIIEDIYSGTISEDEALNIIPGKYVKLQVSDTGSGIPTNYIEKIFEPFFSTKPPGEGTGMGLSVVHGIVKSYGGEITVNSSVNKGSVFTVYLPVTEKDREAHSYVDQELPGGNEKILFVDDESQITGMGKQLLERLGYSIITQNNSIKALELFRSTPNAFDLIITDMTMPEMTGARLTMEIREMDSTIPIILCSGYSKQLSDNLLEELGANKVIYKPILKKDLAKVVRELLDEAKGTIL